METCDYEFRLTPGYCLYNGAAVLEQNGSYIKILVDNEDEKLRQRLQRAFTGYLKRTVKDGTCPDIYKRKPRVEFVHGTRAQLKKCVTGLYEKSVWEKEPAAVAERSIEFEAGKEPKKDSCNGKTDSAAVFLLDSILGEAREKKATDVHIEKNKVKLRVNGRLVDYISLPDEKCEELIQRIKLLGDLNVLEKQKSQNGHFIYGDKNPLFIRVSSVGIIGDFSQQENCSETLVMRILDPERVPLEIEKLGFSEEQLTVLNKVLTLKSGLIVVCGPTGAGKSTTNASLLRTVQKKSAAGLKIVSLEDPPEYVIPEVTQIQVEERKGVTYESGLEQIFRLDPDVIMIGEIRNNFSAKSAVRAALTGHLVFATVHAGSPEEAYLRLRDLCIEEDILDSVLKLVISQELNYLEDQTYLLADVALYGDKQFSHCTNYKNVVADSLKKMFAARKLPLLQSNSTKKTRMA